MAAWALLVALAACVFVGAAWATPVQIGLQTAWSHTPLLQEASEWLASEHNSLFWAFVEAARVSRTSPAATDREQHDFALRTAQTLLSAEQVKLLRIVLAARAQTAAVEMHRAMALLDAPAGFDNDAVDAAFAIVGTHTVASAGALRAALAGHGAIAAASPLLESDHVHPSSGGRANATVILYANLGTPSFEAFHVALLELLPAVTYVLRHRPPVDKTRRIRLPGFGAEMQLKSTEYKVVDDSEQRAAAAPRATADQDDNELEPVPKAEVKGLGVRIAQAISTSEEPLELLQRLSQNFPSECHRYRQDSINASFVASVRANQQRVQAGHTAVLINGRHVNVENINFFELIAVLTDEIRATQALRSVPGISANAARALMIRTSSPNQGEAVQPHYDLRGAHVRYLNDVERDPLTRSWPTSLRNFLRQQWPGQPYMVRRNAFTIIVVADLSSQRAITALHELWSVVGSHEQGTLGAVRVGVVPVGTTREATVLAKAFHVLLQDGAAYAMRLLEGIVLKPALLDGRAAFDSYVDDALASAHLTLETLAESEETYPGTTQSNAWAAAFGLQPTDDLRLFINGREIELLSDSPLQDVAQATAEATRALQIAVYRGLLADSEADVHDWMLRHNGARTSFSRYAGPATDETPFVALAAPDRFRSAQFESGLAELAFVGRCEPHCRLSYIVVADLGTPAGLQLVAGVLARVRDVATPNVRAAFIFHSGSGDDDHVAAALVASAQAGDVAAMTRLVERRMQPHSHHHHHHHQDDDVDSSSVARVKASGVMGRARAFAQLAFGGVAARESLVVLNGRVVRASTPALKQTDFAALEANELSQRADLVASVVNATALRDAPAAVSDSIMRTCSVMGMDEARGIVRHNLSQHVASTTLTLGAGRGAVLVIDALLDPLSPAGKKFGSILLQLLASFDAEVNVVLNPVLELAELPLRQFYRYVAATQLAFTADGAINATVHHKAVFPRLPRKTLFSMSLDVPDAWLVDAVAAPYDLDNLRISEIATDTNTVIGAMYELTHLLVEGNCKDATAGKQQSPVRGMQLRLSAGAAAYETLVMEMGGYFQLKSTPGLWTLALVDRSASLFEQQGDARVAVRDLSGVSRPLRVVRRAGSSEPLLPLDPSGDAKLAAYNDRRLQEHKCAAAGGDKADKGGKGLFGGLFGGKKAGDGVAADAVAPRTIEPSNATINVFSLASGHLYERFLSIMMYTTRKATQAPVKFWFLQQFLSPQFKRFLPQLSAKYGFQFELVSYQWPRWLRRQTEKQRVIWGYKILFLDVLFPLDVERVIFVDADQIVRADLASLHSLDLEGAPYAFTPFCSLPSNRNVETKGFRFWESGYWRDTLGHLPYHISALFVVDLRRFRQQAAGDVLRSAYQQLSQDPNSLANLDQDLPNVLQARLSIYSLPEEWLWCNTWCTDDSLARAKSIDLCQNPMTKEPKIDMAKRVAPDWASWDAELTALRRSADARDRERDQAIIKSL